VDDHATAIPVPWVLGETAIPMGRPVVRERLSVLYVHTSPGFGVLVSRMIDDEFRITGDPPPRWVQSEKLIAVSFIDMSNLSSYL
jgi:hypothetical protein